MERFGNKSQNVSVVLSCIRMCGVFCAIVHTETHNGEYFEPFWWITKRSRRLLDAEAVLGTNIIAEHEYKWDFARLQTRACRGIS